MFAFEIQHVRAERTIYLRADGSVEPLTANITSADNVTYTFTDHNYDEIVVERSNIIIDGAGHTIQGTGDGTGLNLTSISNVTIKNINIKDFYGSESVGICFFYSSYCIITQSNLTYNNCGVWLFNSHHNNISRNKIMHSEVDFTGVWVYKSFHNILCQNNITNAQGSGIEIDDSFFISISENNLTNNGCGVRLSNLSYSIIFGNNILNNGPEQHFAGLDLDRSSSNNTICSNNIENYNTGVAIRAGSNYNLIFNNDVTRNEYGLYLNAYWGQFFDNKIYHNNFINNTCQFRIGNAKLSTNFWDNGYPSGGNYWSDYNGTDKFSGSYQNITGSDGLGDSKYIIDAENTDNHPLMGPISFFNAGTWNGTTYFVTAVSNSTVSDFYFSPDLGAFILFWVEGESINETSGFSRVAVPKDLLWVENGWEIYFGSTKLDYSAILVDNYTYIYFIYANPYQNVSTPITISGTHVIPESSSLIILPLFMTATLLAAIIFRRKDRMKPVLRSS